MGNVTRIAILCLIFAGGILCAQEPAKAPAKPDINADIATLAAFYKADMDQVAKEHEKWLAPLQAWYLAGLDKLMGDRTKAGDLDGALAFKAERERIAAHAETTKEQIQSMPATLGKLRAAYEPALKKIVDEASRREDAARNKHLANLEALQKRLTINGDLDEALLVKGEKERFATEMAQAAGVVLATGAESSQKARNLLSKEDEKNWTIVKGDWKIDNNVLTGEGNSSMVFHEALTPPFTLKFKINVLDGMRPRVRFGPFSFANEGYNTTFGLYPNPDGKLFHYKRKTEYKITIAVSEASVDLSIDDLLVTSHPGVKEKIDKMDFSAGDGWSKGRAEFRDITIEK